VPASGQARWGWHRLSPRWADQIVADAQVSPGDLVVDIGAGTGALTASLVAAGARVIAVELHPQRVAVLRRRFAGDPVTVVRADATDLRLPRRPFRVVANPPFAATTGIMRRLLAPGSPPGRRRPGAPARHRPAVGDGTRPRRQPLGLRLRRRAGPPHPPLGVHSPAGDRLHDAGDPPAALIRSPVQPRRPSTVRALSAWRLSTVTS